MVKLWIEPYKLPVPLFSLMADHHIDPIPVAAAIVGNDLGVKQVEVGYLSQQGSEIIRRNLYDITIFQRIDIIFRRRAGTQAHLVTYPMIIRGKAQDMFRPVASDTIITQTATANEGVEPAYVTRSKQILLLL